MDIGAIPLEILTHIVSFLKRRDRLSFSLVCTRWREATYSPSLWRNAMVFLDDLSEISTLLTMRQYHMFFKTMKFCWTNPYLPTRWMLQRSQDISKKTCRYLMTMCIHNVQLKSVSLIDWSESHKFKKIIYHMCRFLKSQESLRCVCFSNMNFNNGVSMKFMLSCLNSSSSITCLDISNSKPPVSSTFESTIFASCIQQLSNLVTFKVEYLALSNGVLEALLQSKNDNIESLDVFVSYYIHNNTTIRHLSDTQWANLSKLCPKLRVSFYFKNISHFEKINQYLNRAIPLTTFSMSCRRITDQSKNMQCRRTILLLINYYHKTLENICLQINYNFEILDDLIVSLLGKCLNLQQLDFSGIIENMELLREICNMYIENKMGGFKYLHVYPKNVGYNQHVQLREICRDYACKLRNIDIDFLINSSCCKNEIIVYY